MMPPFSYRIAGNPVGHQHACNPWFGQLLISSSQASGFSRKKGFVPSGVHRHPEAPIHAGKCFVLET